MRLIAQGCHYPSLCYGLYYAARRRRYDGLWLYGIVFCFFYLAFLLWQTYYAIATTRSASWECPRTTTGVFTIRWMEGAALRSAAVEPTLRRRCPRPSGPRPRFRHS